MINKQFNSFQII